MKKVLLLICTYYLFAPLSFGQAFKLDPIKIDSILVSSKNKVVSSVRFVGNRRTKSHIISRELDFIIGDTMSNEVFIERLEQTKKNILNTSLFNFCKIDIAMIDSSNVNLIIQITERWYITPLPILEIEDNNFNTWWQDKDYGRINYGFLVTDNNFRGRREKLSVLVKRGFTDRYRLRYSIPYINKSQKLGMGVGFSYSSRNQLTYNTFENKRLQYKNDDRETLQNLSGGLSFIWREKIFNTHSFSINYNKNEIIDTLIELNPNFLGDNRNMHQYLSLSYTFTSDHRDSRNYPLMGYYLRFDLTKHGLGMEESNVDLTNFQFQLKKFTALSDRLFLAGSIRGAFTANNDQPYILQPGLGYSSTGIRSYELYVIDGHNIGLAKAQLRYQIVKPKSVDLGVITDRLSKFHYAFYLGIFSDFGYVEDQVGFPENRLANELQFGSGIGLDFVSYYDIVIRTEFSMNKFGESGLFFHFVAPI